jgi:hypothetical protein
MTLGSLLGEIKYGKELIESKETVKDLQNLIDEDYNILLVGERANQLLRECDSSQSFVRKLARATRNYKDYENKILEGKKPSSIYARMKIDSITEDINSAITEFDNVKILRASNQENIAKTIAVLKYGMKTISEDRNVPLGNIPECPLAMNSLVKKETLIIEGTM